MRLTLDTWLISDTHFGHDNIIRYCNRPADHDAIMAERWRAVVGEDDPILHLGDLVFGRNDLPRLPGEKHLILGNHDRRPRVWYEEHGYAIESKHQWFKWKGKLVLLSHWPAVDTLGWEINIHGHIHNNGYGKAYDRELDFRNISVEVMDYTPVRLRDVLEADNYQSVRDAPIDAWTREERV